MTPSPNDPAAYTTFGKITQHTVELFNDPAVPPSDKAAAYTGLQDVIIGLYGLFTNFGDIKVSELVLIYLLQHARDNKGVTDRSLTGVVYPQFSEAVNAKVLTVNCQLFAERHMAFCKLVKPLFDVCVPTNYTSLPKDFQAVIDGNLVEIMSALYGVKKLSCQYLEYLYPRFRKLVSNSCEPLNIGRNGETFVYFPAWTAEATEQIMPRLTEIVKEVYKMYPKAVPAATVISQLIASNEAISARLDAVEQQLAQFKKAFAAVA